MLIENMNNKQILEYKKTVDAGRLMSELYEEIPELTPSLDEIDGQWDIKLRVFTNSDTLTLWVPADINRTAIDAVVEAHIIEEVTQDAISSDKQS